MNDERWRIDMVSHSGSVAKIYGSLTGCGRCGNGWMAIAVDISLSAYLDLVLFVASRPRFDWYSPLPTGPC